MKIVVLAGGLSPERDVSLSSGSLIANALIENGHQVLLLDLYKGMSIGCSPDDLFTLISSSHRYEYIVPPYEPDLEVLKKETGNGEVLIGENVIAICRAADLVFIALHGDIGENGKLQALFDIHHIRYTGTGYIGSLLAMDKDISKQIMRMCHIRTADWILYDVNEGDTAQILSRIGLPCVVKPCSCGSSIGVSIVHNPGELDAAIAMAQKYENVLLIEKMIMGREFSVGILNGQPLPVIEIIPQEGFYDYANKYQKGFSKEICPAELPPAISLEMQAIAMEVYQALRLSDYARIDFILDQQDLIYCLEANTLPGMTPTSLLPQEALATGISYQGLCERIAEMAIKRK